MIIQKRSIALTAVIMLVVLSVHPAISQGCSDAGLCTIPVLNAESDAASREEQQGMNHAVLGLSFGMGEQDVTVITPYVTYGRVLTNLLSITAKVTYISSDGELGSHAGPGDLYLTGIYALRQTDNGNISVTAGIKLPLSNADAGDDAVSLPMVYQSSLGTYDLLLGIAYDWGKLRISAGWQQPLSGENSNGFLTETHPDSQAAQYLSSNRFERKGDLLLRLSYELPLLNRRVTVLPSLLPIYHLGDDEYSDETDFEQSIDGSQGLTLNGSLGIAWHITRQNSLELFFGTPFITRDARPDGLTRHLVVGMECGISF